MPDPRRTRQPLRSQELTRLSRLVALVLRHRPEEVGLALDDRGFVPIETLALALATQRGWESLEVDDLVALARADPRRYELHDGHIRARYGHTVTVERPGEAALPPEWLYLGAPAADAAGLRETGLRPKDRRFVHLATTPQAALEVARRHTPDPVVVVVFARQARAAGVEFWSAGPALFLSGPVPAGFLLLPDDGTGPAARGA